VPLTKESSVFAMLDWLVLSRQDGHSIGSWADKIKMKKINDPDQIYTICLVISSFDMPKQTLFF